MSHCLIVFLFKLCSFVILSLVVFSWYCPITHCENMVSLTDIQTSNSQIATTLPPGLVTVFVGGTSGIGEITLKKFAKYTPQPRAYIVGRSQNAAERIIAECRMLNPEGEYTFIKEDVSLMRNVDKVCNEIKSKEKAVNLLFMSAGFPSIDGAGQASSPSHSKQAILI